MAENDLPAEVNRLIETVIASMDHVEVLRIFVGAPAERFTAEDIGARLRLDRKILLQVVGDLEDAHLVLGTDGTYTYGPSPRNRDAVDALMQCYNSRPVTLIRAIYARPKPVKAFADAFRLRRSE